MATSVFNCGGPLTLAECEQYLADCDIRDLKAGKPSNAPFDIAKMGKDSWRGGEVEGQLSELSDKQTARIERMLRR